MQIPLLVANALEQQRVQIVGAGLNVWSNVHLDDVVSLYLLALKSAPAGAFIFAESGETSFAAIGLPHLPLAWGWEQSSLCLRSWLHNGGARPALTTLWEATAACGRFALVENLAGSLPTTR